MLKLLPCSFALAVLAASPAVSGVTHGSVSAIPASPPAPSAKPAARTWNGVAVYQAWPFGGLAGYEVPAVSRSAAPRSQGAASAPEVARASEGEPAPTCAVLLVWSEKLGKAVSHPLCQAPGAPLEP